MRDSLYKSLSFTREEVNLLTQNSTWLQTELCAHVASNIYVLLVLRLLSTCLLLSAMVATAHMQCSSG